ncbi:uncharacterized, partial [Tachysurus ichikawai]
GSDLLPASSRSQFEDSSACEDMPWSGVIDGMRPCLTRLLRCICHRTELAFIWAAFTGFTAMKPTRFSVRSCLGVLLAVMNGVLYTFACFVSCTAAVCGVGCVGSSQ